jgi:predicted ester cyclase
MLCNKAAGVHLGRGDCLLRRWHVSVDANKELVRRITEEGLNKGNVGFVDDLFAPDYRVNNAGLDLPRGPEAFKSAVALWRSAFPDFTVTIDALIGEGDLVVNRFHTSGTHTGQLMHVPPTGKRFTVYGADVHRVVDGRVVESWISDDVPRILLEIGALQPAGGPPPGVGGHAGPPNGAPGPRPAAAPAGRPA